ncbi:MAG: DUF5113 domain-containing protein [Bacteroides sp.]|nr:DUF5113 domain-containing protein [Bacteroides sp.]
MALCSCVGTAPSKEVYLIDSLNQVAYAYRYKDLHSSYHAAMKAYQGVKLYRLGKAEACNNLGFSAFMYMDFESAEKWYKEVYGLTKNELELFIADVGLMKIYQRAALNKEYYDYRNKALVRMKRIAEDTNLFVDRHERMRLNYARSEFYIVSAIYYYYLQQRPEAVASLDEIRQEEELAADTNQLLYYHYIRGAAGLCEAETVEARRLREFDELFAVWELASRGGYTYFEGNGIQGMANLMASPDGYEFYRSRRSHFLEQFGVPVDSLLPLRLGQQALQLFREYDDLYQIAGAYVSIGRYLNAHGCYEQALDTLGKALDCVNDHHRRYYDCNDTLDWLKTVGRPDTVCVEKIWMQQKLKTVPEWISRIREQLSVSYAGLGMKSYSDYNRNVYLDILEDTRQDKELESRYQALETESGQLNLIMWGVATGFVVVILFFWIFNSRSKVRNRLHLSRLQLMLDICQKITASIPADAQTEDEITEALLTAVRPQMEHLFGTEDISIENRQLLLPKKLNKDEQAMLKVINPYIQWALENGMTSISLGDERRRLEKQRYVHEQHIAGNKRQNLVKKACLAIVNGIHPYIDRIIREVHKTMQDGGKQDENIKRERYQYMDELVGTINEYNDILALWIKVKQGTLSLNVDTFCLNELFELLRKGSRAFEMKHLYLEVEPTDAYVKADRALTLFMINTLAENARKYTPQGGTVRVYARQAEQYVEISVEDTGCGLSTEDVARIVGEKVYDSKAIGMDIATDPEELKKNKGSGFGLINCKGIIEKYRKTNELFHVCRFDVESTPGKGSRFYFRLPLGVRKLMLVLSVLFCLFSCQHGESTAVADMTTDSLDFFATAEYEALLDSASIYANAAYYSNVDGQFEWALQYIDSAIMCLNAHYVKFNRHPQRMMALRGEGSSAELRWWNEPFNSDFHVILDIRNEAAVAFLALKQWEAYSYNNEAYTCLYKLLGEDQSLEDYCRQLERSTNNKMVGILLAVVLLFALLLGYYVLYVRKRWVNRWNLEQVLEINRQVSVASMMSVADTETLLQQEESRLKDTPQRIVDDAFDAVNELLSIDRLGIAIYNESAHQLEYTSNPSEEEEETPWKRLAQRCFAERKHIAENGLQALPLVVEAGDISRCVGVLCLERIEGTEQAADHLLQELIARYVAIVIFNAVVKLATKYRDIEDAQDEARRASWEDSVLHVQNMVLDNCLSTIKHETLYYPNKVKQLIAKLRMGHLSEEEEKETMAAIGELIEYYKGIFTILSQCASRQLEEVTFKRSGVAVAELMLAADKYFRKASKGYGSAVSLQVETLDAEVSGDGILLRFLLENLIDEALYEPIPGRIYLKAVADGEYIRFLFTDTRRQKSQEELNHLFYPSLNRMIEGERGGLHGTEYLICKQIIRDHDEFAGRRGCRINAELPPDGKGFTVYFTVPARRKGKMIG